MRSKHVLAAVTAALIVAGAGAPAAQAAPADSCTQGSALKSIHAGLIASKHAREGKTRSGLVEARNECTYTLYDDGATHTFREGDVIAGVTAFTWWDWETDGFTRAEVKEFISSEQYTVRVAEVLPDGSLGPWSDVPVVRTPVKYHVFEGQGMTAYQVAGVVLDLDAGTYVSELSATNPYFPGEDFGGTVTLVITPE